MNVGFSLNNATITGELIDGQSSFIFDYSGPNLPYPTALTKINLFYVISKQISTSLINYDNLSFQL